jgi:8-oxo-dGTP pyrophosphatase MutT (NUDIX family)
MKPSAFDDIRPHPTGRPSDRPVRPRDAATLIILDHKTGFEPKVLMGRRNGGHEFMPGKWVFPGGRLDRSDYHAPYASDLRPEVAARLGKTAPLHRARALALAAIRETFEETGLLLGKPAAVHMIKGPWREFLALGALPDLAGLDFVARAVTPAISPKRFDARFFLAQADNLISRERQADCGELDEIVWVDLSAALDLDLPSVTRFVLKELPNRLADPGRPAPSLRFIRGRQQLVLL